MRRTLVYLLIAVAIASVLLTGCKKGTKSGGSGGYLGTHHTVTRVA